MEIKSKKNLAQELKSKYIDLMTKNAVLTDYNLDTRSTLSSVHADYGVSYKSILNQPKEINSSPTSRRKLFAAELNMLKSMSAELSPLRSRTKKYTERTSPDAIIKKRQLSPLSPGRTKRRLCSLNRSLSAEDQVYSSELTTRFFESIGDLAGSLESVSVTSDPTESLTTDLISEERVYRYTQQLKKQNIAPISVPCTLNHQTNAVNTNPNFNTDNLLSNFNDLALRVNDVLPSLDLNEADDWESDFPVNSPKLSAAEYLDDYINLNHENENLKSPIIACYESIFNKYPDAERTKLNLNSDDYYVDIYPEPKLSIREYLELD